MILSLGMAVAAPASPAGPGATGALQIPVWGTESPGATLRSVRVEVSAAPSWLEILPGSPLGPVDIRPDERFVFRIDYRLGAGLPPTPSPAELRFVIRSDSAGVSPDASWTLRTHNGFETFSGECLDSRGVPCGRFRSPDHTPPRTSLVFDGVSFPAAEALTYVSTATALVLRGEDEPGSNEEVAGLSFTGYSDNQPVFSLTETTVATAPFRLAEGRHLLFFGSRDKEANSEEVRTVRVDVDGTPPKSTLVMTPPPVAFGEAFVLGPRFELIFVSSDSVTNGVASGVLDTRFSISGSPFAVVSGTFTIPGPDGPKELRWFSRDNVLNEEAVKSTTVVLDATPPALALSCPASGSPSFCRVFDRSVPLRGSVSDLHLSSWRLERAPGRSATDGFALLSSGTSAADGVLGSLDASSPGFATLRLSAEDAVGNAASEAVDVLIGDPERVFTLGGKGAFEKPSGVAVDASSRVYVADAGLERVLVYDAAGAFVRSYGTDGRAEPSFKRPSGAAVDGTGNVWVADTGNDRVVKLAPDGAVLALVGKSELKRGIRRFKPGKAPGQFKRPAAIVVDAAGNAYVADADNRRVQVLSPEGAFLRELRMPGVPDEEEDEEEPGSPVGVAVDGAGRVYAVDRKGRRVVVFDAAGAVVKTLPLPFEEPWGLAVGAEGKCVAVSDRETGRVVRLDEDGRTLLDFAAGKKPLGLAFGRGGELFAADAGLRQVLGTGFPVADPIVAQGQPAKHGGGFRAQALGAAQPVGDAVATLGPSGGSLRREDKAGVEVPEGALDEALELGVYEPEAGHAEAAAAQGLASAGPAVEFGPEGLTFDKPVTLALPYYGPPAGLAVHHWSQDRGTWEPLPTRFEGGLARAETSHFSLYQVLGPASSSGGAALAVPAAAADAAFVFRDLYAFPNPARGGARQTIRLQAGVADSVSVNVYDVSGEQVYAGSFGPPVVLDDGNGKGPQWTYDLAWDAGGVGSGVYIYVVTAKKAGQADIKKTGRLAVLR